MKLQIKSLIEKNEDYEGRILNLEDHVRYLKDYLNILLNNRSSQKINQVSPLYQDDGKR